MLEGAYSELIAMPCRRYTMPLGILALNPPTFKAYKGTGLSRILEEAPTQLYLLAPRDPRLYWLSIEHKLEDLIEWTPCPRPDPGMGAWYRCTPEKAEDRGEYTLYKCTGLEHLAGSPPPYSRAHGCLVELMILYTKLRAGVRLGDPRCYARWLEWCVTRAAPGREDLASLASKLRNLIEGLTS